MVIIVIIYLIRSIAAPLSDLTKKLSPSLVNWAICHQASVDQLKAMLNKHPILKFVNLVKECVLQTDASDLGLGAVLLQYWDGQHLPVWYVSHKLKLSEHNYFVVEKECLTVVWAVKKFSRICTVGHLS